MSGKKRTNNTELKTKVGEAKNAEVAGSYFSAAILYKEALVLAKKLGNSELIKLCKSKSVEMNKKSIDSGNGFKEYKFSYEFSEKQKEDLKKFMIGFLKEKDKTVVLKRIGLSSFFIPKVDQIELIAKNNMPISHIFATLNSISNQGHNLRGGSLGGYSWFMSMYDINQENIMSMLSNLIYSLIYKNQYGDNMKISEINDYFSQSQLFNDSQLKIVKVGLKKYYEEDYVSALHILVPQFESFLLSVVEKLGINIVALDTSMDMATRTKVLSERDFDSQDFINIFGKDFCKQIKFILFEPMGYKLRHKIAHGEISANECNFQNATLILYLYLVVLARVVKK